MHHDLKIALPYWEAIEADDKCFEIRLNDREFQKGDTVSFCPEQKHMRGSHEEPQGLYLITYVTGYMQRENYVVFGIRFIASQDEIDVDNSRPVTSGDEN